ncbi:MAG: GDP-mannose 4,6-dehydratase [Anaerolineae bacterium]|nr:GDP-mannose 4,6-dehydratase [Anaerolineae bacterium]
MKAFITGAGGFVGQHLVNHLLNQGDTEIFGTTFFPAERFTALSEAGATLQQVNLTDREKIEALLADVRPNHIYHLAAQSFVPESFDNPWDTLRNNIQSQLNILLSMIKLNLNARILIVSSAEVYGAVSPDDIPISEQQPLRPQNPYSVSKLTQDMMGLQYHLSHNVDTIRVRPFNQIGPGQSDRFVAPAFASQIAAIEAGKQEPVIRVGNLTAKRDFTDVRDMVRAFEAVMEKGESGEVYNIGNGQAHSIQELLDTLLYETDAPVTVEEDSARMRPVEVPIFMCDNRKIQSTTGWEPTFTFRQTLVDVLNEWRNRI